MLCCTKLIIQLIIFLTFYKQKNTFTNSLIDKNEHIEYGYKKRAAETALLQEIHKN